MQSNINNSTTGSHSFNQLYQTLQNSTTVYTINIGQTQGGVPCKFNPKDNTITFLSANDVSNTSTTLEEFFHAFQFDMKSSLYPEIVLFLLSSLFCFSQTDSTLINNYQILKNSLINCFDSTWYNSFSRNNGWFYINVSIDSTGNIIDIKDSKIGFFITENELCQLKNYLLDNVKFISYSPDSHFTKKQYFEINNNCINIPFKYSDRIFNKKVKD